MLPRCVTAAVTSSENRSAGVTIREKTCFAAGPQALGGQHAGRLAQPCLPPARDERKQQVRSLKLCCIPLQGRGQWEGDTPAAWHAYFRHLPPDAAPGYFVDVGAGDGVFTSNTFFLERQRCWRGLAVEPTNNEYPKLERRRTGSTTVRFLGNAHCRPSDIGIPKPFTCIGH